MNSVVCPSDPGFVCTADDGGTQGDELISIPAEEILQQLTSQDQTDPATPTD